MNTNTSERDEPYMVNVSQRIINSTINNVKLIIDDVFDHAVDTNQFREEVKGRVVLAMEKCASLDPYCIAKMAVRLFYEDVQNLNQVFSSYIDARD
jgi:hypothetical protein